ncbi:MAG: ABC transporter substrate-binding protein [Gammaproteobacteria bacterium]
MLWNSTPARLCVWTLSLSLAACAIALVGAGRAYGEQAPGGHAGGHFPRTLNRHDGTEIVIARKPSRIVSLSLGTDEVLCALVSPDRIAALSRHAGEPEVSNVAGIAQRVGVFASRNAEHIVSLRPDLVLAARYTKAELRQLIEQTGAPVVLLADFGNLADIEANIRLIGAAIGEEARAEQTIGTMRARLALARRGLKSERRGERILYLAPGHWTAGAETNLHEIIATAGLRNAAAEAGLSGHVKIPVELVLRLDPEVILIGTGYARDSGFRERLLADAQLAPLAAIKRQRIIELPSRYVQTVSQHLADAAGALVEAINALPD